MNRDGLLSTKKYLESIIVPYLPNNYEHETELREYRDFHLEVSGKITGDPKRPNKPAKLIKIIIPKEKIDDYFEAPESSQKSFDEKLIKYIKTKSVNFNPDHGESYDRDTPIEEWLVPFGMTY